MPDICPENESVMQSKIQIRIKRILEQRKLELKQEEHGNYKTVQSSQYENICKLENLMKKYENFDLKSLRKVFSGDVALQFCKQQSKNRSFSR